LSVPNDPPSAPGTIVPFVARLIPCGLGILVIWGGVGYWFHAIPAWMAIVTGLGVGMCVRRNHYWSVDGKTPIINILLLGMYCWGLILAGSFTGAVAGVNHQQIWKTFRAATDEDGIEELAADMWSKRYEEAPSENPLDPEKVDPQWQQDRQQARLLWEKMAADERLNILARWRKKVDWSAELAQSLIIQQSVTVAYAGTNLYWHLAGIGTAIMLAVVSFPLPGKTDQRMNSV